MNRYKFAPTYLIGGSEKMKRLTDRHGNICYTHEGREYSRLIGGISWPASKPGFICVIGESQHVNPISNVCPLWVIAEAEAQDAMALFQRATDLRERYLVQLFLADTDNASMLDLLSHFNRTVGEGRTLSLYPASFPEDLLYHLSMIKDMVEPQSKRLFFGLNSVLPGYLLQVTTEASNEKASDYPPVLALGYAVSYLKATYRDPKIEHLERISEKRTSTSYDPLKWGL
jgi:hypothetical protein